MRIPALIIVALGVLSVSAISPSAAQRDTPGPAACSTDALKGSYTYTDRGYTDGQPYASGGLMSFNGKGQFTVLYTSSIERTRRSATGNYTVDGNCSGSIELDDGTVRAFYLGPEGDSFNFVRIAGEDDAIGGTAKRVSEDVKPSCSLATLTGTYAYSIQGHRDGRPYASSGLFSFDGAGQATVLYTSSIERTQLSVTGTYTVEANCSGSMHLAVDTVNDFYLSPTGDSFDFVRVSHDDVISAEAQRVASAPIVRQPQD